MKDLEVDREIILDYPGGSNVITGVLTTVSEEVPVREEEVIVDAEVEVMRALTMEPGQPLRSIKGKEILP